MAIGSKMANIFDELFLLQDSFHGLQYESRAIIRTRADLELLETSLGKYVLLGTSWDKMELSQESYEALRVIWGLTRFTFLSLFVKKKKLTSFWFILVQNGIW